jgi:hypothetical protein
MSHNPASVQKLQTALHAAKESPGFRFYALYDKVNRKDVRPTPTNAAKPTAERQSGWPRFGHRGV